MRLLIKFDGEATTETLQKKRGFRDSSLPAESART
jgi:hypothetical protein